MSRQLASDRLMTHSHRLVYLICFLLIVIVALRRRYDLAGGFTIELLAVLLVLFTVLFASEAIISRRIKSYHLVYFSLQLIIVQIMGLFQQYQDVWAWLYVVLGFQVAVRCSRREAFVWFSLFAASLLVTLSIEFGVISGLGRALAYIVMGVLMISYDIQYAQHEDTLLESRMLLNELQEATEKLKEHAAQAEELAAVQQRNLMIRELYDSVGQKVFALQLATEATRLLLEKDPGRAMDQITNLQGQTQSALGQMRQLIDQWRPD